MRIEYTGPRIRVIFKGAEAIGSARYSGKQWLVRLQGRPSFRCLTIHELQLELDRLDPEPILPPKRFESAPDTRCFWGG